MSVAKFLFQSLSSLLSRKNTFLITSLHFKKEKYPLGISTDHVRYASLWLCAEQIKKNGVKGSIAELGVYKGEFAKRLNRLFSDRPLYLFDTFEGFAQKDIETEKRNQFSGGDQDFSNTSIELVLSKMPFPKNCLVKKGVFPHTAYGVEDTFCFVSIDADLYEPIISGLQFFYPRLEKGGYIFVHDFNNDHYKGARQAVLEFCKQNNVGYVPLPDSGGTAVITK